MQKLWNEIKRRNVPRVATVYTISAWVVIQVASTVFPPLHIPDWVLSFIIILALVGFPIAVILSWIFQLTPNNVVVENRINEPEEVHYGKRIFTSNVAISILIVIVIGQFIYFNNSKVNANEQDKSIAVIPFDNLTNDADLESFTDGMTEEIISHLSKIASLRVTSRTSVKGFKKSQASIPEIASKLFVNNVLEGSIRKSGSKIRITAELIDAKTDKHIWSDDYDYLELQDILKVQTDVSTKVAKALKNQLTDQEKLSLSKNYTENIEAYKFYLKGKSFWDKRSRADFDSAEANFKKAISIDPQYALAYSGLADCYVHSNFKSLSQVEAMPIAKAYLLKALQIDSNLCEAITTLGFIQSHFDYHWQQGRRTLERALQCNPNYPMAHVYLSNIALLNGHKSGLREIKTALELDPLSPTINWVFGRAYYCAGELDSSIAQLQRTLKLFPEYNLTRTTLSLAYLEKKDFGKAQQVIGGLPQSPFLQEYKGLFNSEFLAVTGRKDLSEQNLNESLKSFEGLSNYRVAQIWTILGNRDKAIENLERAYERKEITLIFVNVDRILIPLKKDTRFQALLKKMNFEKSGYGLID